MEQIEWYKSRLSKARQELLKYQTMLVDINLNLQKYYLKIYKTQPKDNLVDGYEVIHEFDDNCTIKIILNNNFINQDEKMLNEYTKIINTFLDLKCKQENRITEQIAWIEKLERAKKQIENNE